MGVRICGRSFARPHQPIEKQERSLCKTKIRPRRTLFLVKPGFEFWVSIAVTLETRGHGKSERVRAQPNASLFHFLQQLR